MSFMQRVIRVRARLCTLVLLAAMLQPNATAYAQAPTLWNWQLISQGFPLQPYDPRGSLASIYAKTTTDVYLAGCYRCLERWDGTTFSAQTQPAGNNRYTVSGAPDGSVYSAGQSNLLRFDGSSWTTVLQASSELFSTYVAPDGTVFTSGDGVIYRNAGAGYVSLSTGLSTAFNTDRLLAMTGFSANDVFIGGYGGKILRFNGTTFTLMNTGTTEPIDAIDARSPTQVYAVGQHGTVLHFNGVAWSTLPPPALGNLRGVEVLGDNDIIVSGDGGVLARWNGVAWSYIDLGTTLTLGNISTPDNGQTLFIVALTTSDVRFYEGRNANPLSSTVPEPGSFALVGLGIAALVFAMRNRPVFSFDRSR